MFMQFYGQSHVTLSLLIYMGFMVVGEFSLPMCRLFCVTKTARTKITDFDPV